jgi:DNA-directed RNA polymerase alpha subunit
MDKNISKNEQIMKRELKKIGKNFLKQIETYQSFIKQSELDLPIEVLCLPSAILTILKREGISRVFHLSGRDLTKIKGIGGSRLSILQTSLNKVGFV